MGQRKFSTNRASAPLNAAITTGATSVVLTAGKGALFPALAAGEYFYAVIQKGALDTDVREYVKVTARASDTLTITRAQGGSTAQSFAAGDVLAAVVVAADLDNLVQKDGDSMSGSLTLTGGPNQLAITPAADTDTVLTFTRRSGTTGKSAQIVSYVGTTSPQPRWGMELGNGTSEAGSNAGSNFAINRYNDAGAYLGSPFSIVRSTGEVGIPYITMNRAIGADANATPLTIQGFQSAGSPVVYSRTVYDVAPNYTTMYMQALHVTNQWAGLRMACGNGSYFDFYLSDPSNPTMNANSGWRISNSGFAPPSDRRVKFKIRDVVNPIELFKAIRFRQFHRTDTGDETVTHFGVIAQELRKHPHMRQHVNKVTLRDPKTHKRTGFRWTVNESAVHYLGDAALSALIDKFEDLEDEVRSLRAEVKRLKRFPR